MPVPIWPTDSGRSRAEADGGGSQLGRKEFGRIDEDGSECSGDEELPRDRRGDGGATGWEHCAEEASDATHTESEAKSGFTADAGKEDDSARVGWDLDERAQAEIEEEIVAEISAIEGEAVVSKRSAEPAEGHGKGACT